MQTLRVHATDFHITKKKEKVLYPLGVAAANEFLRKRVKQKRHERFMGKSHGK